MENRSTRRNDVTPLIHAITVLIYLFCSVYLLITAVFSPGKIAPLNLFILSSVICQLIFSLFNSHKNEAVDNEI